MLQRLLLGARFVGFLRSRCGWGRCFTAAGPLRALPPRATLLTCRALVLWHLAHRLVDWTGSVLVNFPQHGCMDGLAFLHSAALGAAVNALGLTIRTLLLLSWGLALLDSFLIRTRCRPVNIMRLKAISLVEIPGLGEHGLLMLRLCTVCELLVECLFNGFIVGTHSPII